ncbi:DUF6193 family natural product biosynthesis protein [Streptomyces sp. NPDC057494]|uniref:DUF6193 family natural product biosynthesis protein n=1 Tax=Streptomyces sp. NPDC057494 TaxID=3346148 RepID=UPI0036BB0599
MRRRLQPHGARLHGEPRRLRPSGHRRLTRHRRLRCPHRRNRPGYGNGTASDRTVLGEPDTVEESVELIVANLPDGCGPATDGTLDDL